MPTIASRMKNVIGINKVAAIYYRALDEILRSLKQKLDNADIEQLSDNYRYDLESIEWSEYQFSTINAFN